MKKPRTKAAAQSTQTGRIILIRDGKVLTRPSRKTPRLAACGPAACG